jgi:hypothetical protein
MALFSPGFRSARKTKKIKNRLTQIAVKLPQRKAAGSRVTSSKQLNLNNFHRHSFDTIEPCALTIAAPKKQRKSPADGRALTKNA